MRTLREFFLIALLMGSAAAAEAVTYGTPSTPPLIKAGTKPETPWMTPLAVEVVTNGGFESGGIGWFVSEQGGGAWFVNAGTTSPLLFFTIPGPPEGTFQAVVDQTGPGTHILFQDVTIPAGSTANLNLVLWYANQADFFSPATLDFNVSPNQQFRIDIMDPAAPLDDVGAGVYLSVFATNPGDPLSIGYTPITANLDAFAGQTVRLRFAEVDNQFYFTVGVDAVSIQAEPIVPATTKTWGEVKDRYR